MRLIYSFFPSALMGSILLADTLQPTPSSYIGSLNQILFSKVTYLNIDLTRRMEKFKDHFPCVSERSWCWMNLFDLGRWDFYLGPVVSFGKVRSLQDQTGFHDHSVGGYFGFDYAFSQWGVGCLAFYTPIRGTFEGGWGKFENDQAHLSFYFSADPTLWPGFSVNGSVGGGVGKYHLFRDSIHNVRIQPRPIIALGNPYNYDLDAFLEVEYDLARTRCVALLGSFDLIPWASLQYIYFTVNSYREFGAGEGNMIFSNLRDPSLRSFLGAKMKYQVNFFCFDLKGSLNMGWQREYLDRNSLVYFAPANDPSDISTLEVFGAGRNTFIGRFDLSFGFYRNCDMELSYDLEWNTLFYNHYFFAGFQMSY